MNERPRETAAPTKGERHRLTVLFSDLVGSTVLGREMESEHFSELLGKLRDIWHQAAVKHGGLVIRTQGDGVLAIFGYPHSGEDDSRRAAEAALDIHEWVSQVQHDGLPPARLPLRMHSGIHAGAQIPHTVTSGTRFLREYSLENSDPIPITDSSLGPRPARIGVRLSSPC